jgi:uncharacterized repeat protein (TIGR03803 family)
MKHNVSQVVILFAMLVASVVMSFATDQTAEKAIFSFNLTDGNLPNAGLVADGKGNLYGTTSYNGGTFGFGNVFELSPTSNGVKETVLYNFTGGADGGWPLDNLIFDSAGNLYGTTESGGQGECIEGGGGCGVVFELSPSKTGWKEAVLFSFIPGQVKGVIPVGGLVFDKAGNLYGTTWAPGVEGGPFALRNKSELSANTYWGCSLPGCGGTVFELSPFRGGWQETDIYAFTGGSDGSTSQANLIFDSAGNLYGTTVYGGSTGCAGAYGCGVVFELTPSGGDWTETVLHEFTGASDGSYPSGSLIFDKSGNLYSTASAGGTGNGNVFELQPGNQGWAEKVLYTFTGGADGATPTAAVTFDSQGHLYGTTNAGGTGFSGVVFKLTNSNGTWSENVLHTFAYGAGDGQAPAAPLIFGPRGYLFGTCQAGGKYNHGAVFAVAP